MNTKRSIALAATLCGAMTMPTTAAANPAMKEAESIRTLDMMLMATSLRCRKGADDFRAEYDTFSRLNKLHLTHANTTMRRSLNSRYGVRGATRELDRRSVKMANRFGNGHPWMDCGELKEVAGELAKAHSRAFLADMANRLLTKPKVAFDLP